MGGAIKGSLSVVDDLTSVSTTKALSAAQGKVLLDGYVAGDAALATAHFKGLIQGGLIWDSTTTPPKIRSGQYDVAGTMVNLTADATLAFSDVFGVSRNVIEVDNHYLVCMNAAGTKKIIVYGENIPSGATGTITSIVESPAGTFTLTAATGTVPSPTNRMIVITSGSTVLYSGKLTGGNSSTTLVFIAPAGSSFTGATTWTVYDKINTLHGTGTSTQIADANLPKYTPSLGENGWSAGIAAWSDTLQGFYLTLTGLTGYRVLGSFNVGASTVDTAVISYKTGRDKNDNNWKLSTPSGTLVTNAVRYSTITGLSGCDYIYNDNGSVGGEISILKDCLANVFHNHYTSGTNPATTMLIGTSTNTLSSSSQEQYLIGSGVVSSTIAISLSLFAHTGQVIKVLASVALSADTRTRFVGTLTL